MRKFLWRPLIVAVGVLTFGAYLGSGAWTGVLLPEPDQLVCKTVETRAGMLANCSMVEETTLWQRLTTEYTYHALGGRDGAGQVAEAGEGRESRTSPSNAPWWRRAITLVAPAAAQQPVNPQTSLAHAVRVAEQQTGGRARKAEMERESGIYVYEIRTVSKDRSAKVLVDPASGKVLRVDTPGFVSSIASVFDRDDQRKDQSALARLDASSMTLAGAIDAAEKETGGRAVKAAVKSQYGSTLFEVSVVKDWTMHRVVVDPATANVVTVPATGKRKDDD